MSYNFHSIWCSFVTLLLVTNISVLISIFWYYFSQLGSDRIQSLFAFFQILENSAMQFIRSVFGRTSEVWIVEGGGIVFISTFMFLNEIHFEKMHVYFFSPMKKGHASCAVQPPTAHRAPANSGFENPFVFS